MIVRVTDMLENAHYKNPIFQYMISLALFEIETRGRVFYIALGLYGKVETVVRNCLLR